MGCANLSFVRGENSSSVDRAHWVSDAGATYVLVYGTDSAEEWSGPSVGHYYFAHNGEGVLIGGTVVLNTRDHAWASDGRADALDIQGTVTALIGRALGTTSAMEGNATYPRYAPGETDKQTLGADDIAAFEFLYPGTTCAAPMPPEAQCSGIPTPGGEPCPPRPETHPGDAGTLLPGGDAGLSGGDAPFASGGDAGPGAGLMGATERVMGDAAWAPWARPTGPPG